MALQVCITTNFIATYRECAFACAGLPDGMTVDADGKLWVAVYGGGAIVQMDPETQTELMKIEMPVLCPTSMAFGGIITSNFHLTFRLLACFSSLVRVGELILQT